MKINKNYKKKLKNYVILLQYNFLSIYKWSFLLLNNLVLKSNILL